MPIYIRCPFCKSDQNVKNKRCKSCGKPLPKQGKTYKVRVEYNGRVVTKNCPTLELAKELEVKIKTEMIEGTYYDRRKEEKAKTPFCEFFEKKYLPDAKNNKSEKSYKRELQLYRYIKAVIGNKPLKDISPFDLECLKKQMREAKLSERSIEYALAVVRQVFNKAKAWGYFEGENPVSKVKKPKKDNRRQRFLTPEEAQALLEECKKRSRQLYEICLLSLHTGMRAGEIFNLTWADIDFKNELIYIKDPKNRNNRVAYMTPEVKEMLEAKPKGEPSELVFKDRKGNRIKTISRSFSRAVKALGLNDGITDPRDKVVFHTLRHTFASWLAIQGTPIYTIKELMGHKTLAMTERYSHLIPDAKREAVKGLTGMFKKRDNVVKLENRK